MSFAQMRNYFRGLKWADWQLIIKHIQSFMKDEQQLNIFFRYWSKMRYYPSPTRGSDVSDTAVALVLVLVLQLRRRRAKFFPEEASKTAVHCVLDGRRRRCWQLKGAKLCAAASRKRRHDGSEKRPRETI